MREKEVGLEMWRWGSRLAIGYVELGLAGLVCLLGQIGLDSRPSMKGGGPVD